MSETMTPEEHWAGLTGDELVARLRRQAQPLAGYIPGQQTRDLLLRAAEVIEDLTRECERHRRANLVRAVTKGVDPVWVSDIITAEGFDAVPWLIAEKRIERTAANDET